jgi:small subunit ribosomal protein S8
MLTDPIADMLTRIRNANRALQDTVEMPTSNLKENIARLLKEEGYVQDYRVLDEQGWRREHPSASEKATPAYKTLVIELKFGKNRERIISDLRRISKPGRRIYAGKDRLPRVLGGMGTAILSTSSGVITSKAAAERGVGGEVICYIW